MIRINLLPHREQKRQARQRQFVSLSIGLAIMGLALVGARARDPRRADREPGKPQRPAQVRDREARRADQGDRQAARADAGAARAEAGRRNAAVQPDRSRPPARSDGAAAAGRHLSEVAEADGRQDHARRLRAVERAGLDADAQHRFVALAPAAGARRDQARFRRRWQRICGSTSSRSTSRSSSRRRPKNRRRLRRRPAGAGGAAGGSPAPRPAKAKGAKDYDARRHPPAQYPRSRQLAARCRRRRCCSSSSSSIVAAGAVLDWKDQYEALDRAQQEEVKLKEQYATKKAKAINYDIYVQQLKEIEQSFGALLKQLPNKAEMDALLTDINQAGLGRGLQFELFKPAAQERMADFYAELPIAVKITGNYHDMGAFASDVAQLPRIVTLNDVAITNDKGVLTLDAVAKTFRYLDEEELAKQRKAAKDAKDEGQEMKRWLALALGACVAARGMRRRKPPGSARVDGRPGQGRARARRSAAADQALRAVRLQRVRPSGSLQAAQDRADQGGQQARARSHAPPRAARSLSAGVAQHGRNAGSKGSRRTRWCARRTRTSTR